MQKKQQLLAVSGLIALSTIAMPHDAEAGKKDKEKCYGIAKAGKNDCGNAQGTHSCAGQAAKDADGGEWIYVPKGACDKIVGGSTEPKV